MRADRSDPADRPVGDDRSLLEVDGLRVSFTTPDGVVQAVRGVSFTVDRGRTLGIVGESGAGKSVCTQAMLRLQPGATVSGSAVFDGRDLLTLADAELRAIRGNEIAVIFQDPLSNLHPFHRVGWQIGEVIRVHTGASRRSARSRAVELLDLVGIPQAARRVDDYPHQFSGGMRQRAMIAMALALNPALLIADEPTTALDVTVQAQIIELIRNLQAEFHTAVIMITHDLGVLADLADDIVVMYAGSAVEVAPRRALYYAPQHPYTRGLLGSLPGREGRRGRLSPIPGQPPSLISLPSGCPFHPRCPHAMDRCRVEQPVLETAAAPAGTAHPAGVVQTGGHEVACWLPAAEPTPSTTGPTEPAGTDPSTAAVPRDKS